VATSLASILACGSSKGTDADAGTDSSGGPDAGNDEELCTGTNAAGSGDAWTAMPLINDTSNPAHDVTHVGADVVSGIFYESADKGYIVSQDDGLMNVYGGAVFKATGTAVTAIAFSGDNTGGDRHDGTIDFIGIEKSPTGYIAMAYASEVIGSDDGGATFAVKGNAAVDRFGIDRILAYRVTASGTTMVSDSGVISSSTAAPGPAAAYDDIWESDRSRPASQCQDGPKSASTPTTRYSAYVSPDRSLVAYTSAPGQVPTICISTDGGRSFTARSLGVSTVTTAPSGVMFMTKKRGIAWFGSSASGSAYVKRTVDGGVTWTSATLPADLASAALELPVGFLGTDCMHGWLAGYDNTATSAVLLSTSDGGATWTRVAGVAEAVDAVGGDKLYSGFALDTAHIWLGGARGVVVHN
jgi:hypothetical protein